jgi:hypothetical protein
MWSSYLPCPFSPAQAISPWHTYHESVFATERGSSISLHPHDRRSSDPHLPSLEERERMTPRRSSSSTPECHYRLFPLLRHSRCGEEIDERRLLRPLGPARTHAWMNRGTHAWMITGSHAWMIRVTHAWVIRGPHAWMIRGPHAWMIEGHMPR